MNWSKSLLLCTLLALSLPAMIEAQIVTVSEAFTLRDDDYYEILPDERGNVLLFKSQNSEAKVIGFDNQLRKRWEKELELDKKRPRVIRAVSMGNDWCLFYEFRYKLQPVLKAHRYSPGANLLDSLTISIFDKLFYSPAYQIEVSEDKQLALIWFIEDVDKFHVFSFSMKQMQVLWHSEFTIDDFLYQRDFVQMLVDNEGNMYLVLDRDNRPGKSDEHRLEIFMTGAATGGQMMRHLVSMEGHLTFDIKFSIDNLNKRIVAAGLYGQDNTTRADGYFFLSIARDDFNDRVLVFHPFDADFLRVLLEKDKERAKVKGLTEVSVQQIVHRRDGGIILLAELNKAYNRGLVTNSYYIRSGARPIVDYYYDDVFMISLHPDGSEHWKRILHKKQYSQDDEASYSSFFLERTPTALRLVFNDEIKSENTVSQYVVRGDGSFDHDSVMNTERKDLSLMFRYGVQISANAIIVPSERRHRLKLVKIEL